MKLQQWTVTVLAMFVVLAVSAVNAAEKKAPVKQGDTKQTVNVKVRSWKSFERLVRSHKGKVVVVDIWTTTCGACLEEFPNFAALGRKYSRDQIALVSLNCDYDGVPDKPPAFYRDDVLKFLRKQRATFDNVLLDVPFIDFLDQVDLASTPAILVYAPDGRLVKRFDNDDALKIEDEYSIDDVKRLVDMLVKKVKSKK